MRYLLIIAVLFAIGCERRKQLDPNRPSLGKAIDQGPRHATLYRYEDPDNQVVCYSTSSDHALSCVRKLPQGQQ